MKSFSLTHLDDQVLLRDLATLVSQDRATTAALLAHLAEVEERRLYARAAHSSMHLYCVRELHMSEETAFRRIRVARTARRFPAIFAAVAEGRLNLTAVLLLTPYLTRETAKDLLAAAAYKTKAEVELLLAERFPRRDLPTTLDPIASAVATDELAPEPVAPLALQQVPEPVDSSARQLAPEPVASQLAPDPVASRARLTPLSPGRFALQVTVDQEIHDQLRYAQSLLGHAVPSGDVATVLKRALGSLIQQLEQRKFARSARSRPRRSRGNGRYIPAAIRSAIWQRDGGQCAFVSEGGKRCEERKGLDFDHVDPVARGGQASLDRMRLLCRAHNQYTAECTFGAGFMREKRERRRAECKARKEARTQKRLHECSKATAMHASQSDVLSCLRRLGFTSEEAHRGATLCDDIPDAPLEKQRIALGGLAPPCAVERRAARPLATPGARC